jgi:SAM-dependent methyltransferase
VTASWQFFGGPGALPYRVFDALRRALNRKLVRDLTAMTRLPHGARVLEAGSGPGYGSSLFGAASGARLSVAADIDIAALREGRRRDPSLVAVVADLRRLPFRDGAFDLVWNSSTLEHLDRPELGVIEMRRITRQGGHVFVGVPSRLGPLGFQPLIARTGWGIWIGPVFDRARLSKLLASGDLIPTAHTRYFLGMFLGMLARSPSPSERAGGP